MAGTGLQPIVREEELTVNVKRVKVTELGWVRIGVVVGLQMAMILVGVRTDLEWVLWGREYEGK